MSSQGRSGWSAHYEALGCASELAERCPVKAEVGGQRITRLCMLRCASELARDVQSRQKWVVSALRGSVC